MSIVGSFIIQRLEVIQREKVEEKIKNLKLEKKVKLLGFVKGKDLEIKVIDFI